MVGSAMPRSLRDMATKIEQDAAFRDEFLSDPTSVLEEAVGQLPNTKVYHIVVGSLGVALILCLLASVAVLMLNRGTDGSLPEVPDIFVTATSTIIGALAGLLLPQS